MRRRCWIAAAIAVKFMLLFTLVGCGPGGMSILDSLNLKGEARFVVGDQVYAVAEVGFGSLDSGTSAAEISLSRRFPEGSVSAEDIEALSAIDIVLVSGDGDRVSPPEITLRPTAGENGNGYVVLEFDLGGEESAEKKWVLEWPEHDPMTINDPAMNAEAEAEAESRN